MKKIVAFALALLLLFSMSVPAFADVGEPDFDDWYVICGPEGYNFIDVSDYGQDSMDMSDFLEPGTKLMVYYYHNSTKEYMLIIQDANHKIKGKGFVNLPEADLNRYFIDENKIVDKEFGVNQNEQIQCIVTADSGIVLRQGPATTFKSYGNVPHNTKLSYQYTYEYGGYHWGYITYKGQNGWVCIDYTERTSPTTVATTVPKTEPTTERATKQAIEINTQIVTTKTPDSVGDTGSSILIFIIMVVVLALVALTVVIVLVLTKRKK